MAYTWDSPRYYPKYVKPLSYPDYINIDRSREFDSYVDNFQQSDMKVVCSGDLVEYYKYSRFYSWGYKVSDDLKIRRKRVVRSVSSVRTVRSLSRARNTLKRLIEANVGQYGQPANFMTFTFSDDIIDLQYANKLFTSFIKRFNYFLWVRNILPCKYVVVPEIQKKREIRTGKAVWHFHALFFNLPYIPQYKLILAELWGRGFVKPISLNKVQRVGSYVSKYIRKGSAEQRLFRKKAYFASRGLIKPQIYRYPQFFVDIESQGIKMNEEFRSEFGSPFGKVIYQQYRINNKQNEI